MSEEGSGDKNVVMFKKKRGKNRNRRAQHTREDVGHDDDSTSDALENVRDELKCRSREKGLNSQELLKKTNEPADDEIIQQYGLIDPKQNEEDEFANAIQTAFSEETGRQERDRAMLKFVNKRLQEEEGLGNSVKELSEYEKLQEKLWEVPDHLKTREREDEVTKGMLSSELLRGVPEVKGGLLNKVTAAHEAKYKKKGMNSKKTVPKSHLFESIMAGLKQERNQLNYSSARFEKGTAIHMFKANEYNSEMVVQRVGKRSFAGKDGSGNVPKKANV
eukprot:m.10244 g.10244  ORF g.10244 m.10244 type:complete len:276 (-) comp3637_c0_seq1:179-1006(-)